MISELVLIVMCVLLGYAFRGKIGKYVKMAWAYIVSKEPNLPKL